MDDILRKIPAVNRVLKAPELADALAAHPTALVTEAVRQALDGLREAVRSGAAKTIPAMAEIAALVGARIERLEQGRFCPVVNATGIIIHTGLGRAPLPDAAMEALRRTAGGYLALELDLDTGERGSRQRQIEELLCRITGAEAGMVVNNNAGAVLLGLDTLARAKEVIVSRSELVEIGGSFRMPDVMAKGGVRLVEVGTTNKTRLDDYRKAITSDTALFLKVHQSNFRIVGFSDSVHEEELSALGREFGIPVMHDAGSGAMAAVRTCGFHKEPLIRDSVKAGVEITTFSGDKLLGGPQAGLIVGQHEFVDRLKGNPLARALRPGKLCLAALEATLRLYIDDDLALSQVPVLRMMNASAKELEKRAKKLSRLLRDAVGNTVTIEIEDGLSAVGGGSLPAEELPTKVVAVSTDALAAQDLANRLRANMPPIIARVHEGKVLFDPRTITDDGMKHIAAALARLATP